MRDRCGERSGIARDYGASNTPTKSRTLRVAAKWRRQSKPLCGALAEHAGRMNRAFWYRTDYNASYVPTNPARCA